MPTYQKPPTVNDDARAVDIYREAARIISEKGFDATSMGDIAETVDLTKGGLYYYIKGKKALLYAIMNFVLNSARRRRHRHRSRRRGCRPSLGQSARGLCSAGDRRAQRDEYPGQRRGRARRFLSAESYGAQKGFHGFSAREHRGGARRAESNPRDRSLRRGPQRLGNGSQAWCCGTRPRVASLPTSWSTRSRSSRSGGSSSIRRRLPTPKSPAPTSSEAGRAAAASRDLSPPARPRGGGGRRKISSAAQNSLSGPPKQEPSHGRQRRTLRCRRAQTAARCSAEGLVLNLH